MGGKVVRTFGPPWEQAPCPAGRLAAERARRERAETRADAAERRAAALEALAEELTRRRLLLEDETLLEE